MAEPDLQFAGCDRLVIGSRGSWEEQLRSIGLCRRFDGAVLFREGEVMVIEIGGEPGEIDDLLATLPRKDVTHLWRSGGAGEGRPSFPTSDDLHRHVRPRASLSGRTNLFMIQECLESCDGHVATEPARWFAECVQPHESNLRGYLRNRFPILSDPDDIVQEAYLRLWKARARGSVRNVRSLLFTTARNLALNAIRRRRNAPFRDVSLEYACSIPDEQLGIGESLSYRQEAGFLAAAVDALPPRCREAIQLKRLDELPQKVVALRLGVSERTVDAHVQKGIRRCAEYLEAHGVMQHVRASHRRGK